jgi:hypothetical protein
MHTLIVLFSSAVSVILILCSEQARSCTPESQYICKVDYFSSPFAS